MYISLELACFVTLLLSDVQILPQIFQNLGRACNFPTSRHSSWEVACPVHAPRQILKDLWKDLDITQQ